MMGQAAGAPADVADSVRVQSIWDFVVKGGPMMVPIGICSLIAVAIMIERLSSLRRRNIIPTDFLPGLKKIASSRDDDREENNEGRNRFFESANVTFSSVLARNVAGELLDASMDLPAVVNVVSMEDGREIVLPDAVLPIGTYDQLVVVMKQVQGVTYDGTTITIDPPGGGWTAIVPVCEFVVGDGETSVVGLTFMVREAFKWRDNRFHFSPRMVCVAEEEAEG